MDSNSGPSAVNTGINDNINLDEWMDISFSETDSIDEQYDNDQLNDTILMTLVSGNMEEVKNNLRSSLNIPKALLFTAIQLNDAEILDLVLNHPEVDLNYQNPLKYTPLLASLKRNLPDDIVLRLLEAGCDVNITNYRQETALHFAVMRQSVVVPKYLIEKGTDINVIDMKNWTPLHRAINVKNIETVSLLLYYSADTQTISLAHLFACSSVKLTKIMFNYIERFDGWGKFSCKSLFTSAMLYNPNAIDMAKAGGDVNGLFPQSRLVLYDALAYRTPKLFLLLWEGFDFKRLLHDSESFLLAFFGFGCNFGGSDWIYCFLLLLQCPVINQLIRRAEMYIAKYPYYVSNVKIRKYTVLTKLFIAFYYKEIGRTNRTFLLNLLLHVDENFRVSPCDVNLLVEIFGVSTELDVLIPCTVECNHDDRYYPVVAFLMVAEESYNSDYVANLFMWQFSDCCDDVAFHRLSIKYLTDSFGYFSFRYSTKQSLFESGFRQAKSLPKWVEHIYEEVKNLPEFPSLVELSRNQAREYLKSLRRQKTASAFYELVSLLKVPQIIKNFITFKQPIYC